MARAATIIGLALAVSSAIFLGSLLPRGSRRLSPLENIQGIPYPQTSSGHILITEKLAHADVFLTEPVLAKQLVLEISFMPINLKSLSVGVREDSFWLSYGHRQEIFSLEYENSPPARRTRRHGGKILTSTLAIPLTDKLQETDRSLDLMFFAEAEDDAEPLWELHELNAEVRYATFSYAQLKNYAGSIIRRERAL